MGIPCRAATVRGVRCEARPGLTSRASCPAGDLDTLPDVRGEPAGRADGALILLTLTAYPAGRLRLAQPRRMVRRRPARRPGRVHGRRSGPVERRRAGRRGDGSRMAGQAQLVSGRHRGPDDPATGAAGPILGLSTQAAGDCSPRQIRSRTRMHSIRHHPASVGTQIRQFGRGATGHGSDQDAAHSGGYVRV
jgi:hypothetical protein